VEICLTLFLFALLYPKGCMLNRGNHEERSQNETGVRLHLPLRLCTCLCPCLPLCASVPSRHLSLSSLSSMSLCRASCRRCTASTTYPARLATVARDLLCLMHFKIVSMCCR
jgi:hypothetical protein